MPKQSFNFSTFLFTHYGYAGTFSTYASLFFAARGMTAAQIGVLMSLIQVMRIVGPNLWGALADHTGYRARVLRLTACCSLIAFSGMFWGRSFAQLFAAVVLVNLFSSAHAPLAEAMMLSDMRGDMTHYGRVRMWGSVGFIVAVMAAGYGLEWGGVTAFPWIAAGMLVLVAGASLRIREVASAHGAQAAPPLWSVLRQRAVIAFFAQAALMVAAHTSLYVYYSLYLAQNGYSKPVIGAMWSIGVLAEVVFFYFQAAVFKRIEAQRLMMFAFAVAIARFIMVGSGAHWLALLVLAQTLHGVTFGAHHSASIMRMQRWFGGALAARGQALFISMAYGVGGSLGGLLMALCWDQLGPVPMYYVAALLAAAGAVAAWLSRRWQ
jgi:PPP family 3-phenylpropionic acid transporter